MSATRALPRELPEAARSAAPLALIILAAAIPLTRPFVLAGLIGGVIVAIGRDAPVRWAWAAPIPVAVGLCWGLLPAPLADPGGADCASLVSPPAIWRLAEAALVLGSLAILGYALGATRASMALRRPARRHVSIAVAGAVVLGPIGLLIGALLAAPFFGAIEFAFGGLGFLLPALVFAIANGVMEELAYRGALLGWTAKVTGTWVALVAQAVVFGLAHGGADVGGSPIVLMAVLGLGGFIAGVITLRTRSLLIPIAWHVALDLPLYAYLACRTT